MKLSLQSKIAGGIGLLFALLLTMSVVAVLFISQLSGKTENLLASNYNTIRYCSEMYEAIDEIDSGTTALHKFENSLVAQEHNITEPGEFEATQKLRNYFEKVKSGARNATVIHEINKQIYAIYILNQVALERKNNDALRTAGNAKLWLSLLTTALVLISLSLLLNFPRYIAKPVKLLTEGIKEIARKNYDKRIYIENNDEFGEMAHAFNEMARRLYEYEHSNLSQLMFEKKRVETIINQMEDAVTGVDLENRILFMNHKAEELYGLREADIVGKYAYDIARHNDLLRTMLMKNGKQPPLKIVLNGKESYFVANYRAVWNEGQQIGEVLSLRDITSFRELDISKTNLLATISHELKTPISSIKMSTRLINDVRIGNLNEEQKELVENIDEDANRLLRITGELLNMTQIETGNIQLKLQKVKPAQIVAESINAVAAFADQKNIKLEVDVAEHLQTVQADADKTSWVLINFLTNAIKYTPENGKIVVRAAPSYGKVRFSVTDFGRGIEEKYLSRIFDRYFKVPGGIEKSSTGLGLAISKEFIDAEGGIIDVKSEFGRGSEFSFSLPT